MWPSVCQTKTCCECLGLDSVVCYRLLLGCNAFQNLSLYYCVKIHRASVLPSNLAFKRQHW